MGTATGLGTGMAVVETVDGSPVEPVMWAWLHEKVKRSKSQKTLHNEAGNCTQFRVGHGLPTVILQLFAGSDQCEVGHPPLADGCESLVKCNIVGLAVPPGVHNPDCHYCTSCPMIKAGCRPLLRPTSPPLAAASATLGRCARRRCDQGCR